MAWRQSESTSGQGAAEADLQESFSRSPSMGGLRAGPNDHALIRLTLRISAAVMRAWASGLPERKARSVWARSRLAACGSRCSLNWVGVSPRAVQTPSRSVLLSLSRAVTLRGNAYVIIAGVAISWPVFARSGARPQC